MSFIQIWFILFFFIVMPMNGVIIYQGIQEKNALFLLAGLIVFIGQFPWVIKYVILVI